MDKKEGRIATKIWFNGSYFRDSTIRNWFNQQHLDENLRIVKKVHAFNINKVHLLHFTTYLGEVMRDV